jgi:hypothetical protein
MATRTNPLSMKNDGDKTPKLLYNAKLSVIKVGLKLDDFYSRQHHRDRLSDITTISQQNEINFATPVEKPERCVFVLNPCHFTFLANRYY